MPVMYPIGRAPDGQLVHIDHWRDEAVTCVGCAKPLIGKRGPIVAHHFAHAVEGRCSSETVLHASTKEAVVAAHAIGPLKFWWSCHACGETRRTTTEDLELSIEVSPCDGVRSDVLGIDASIGPRLAIEVVVTHAPEPETIAKYRQAGVSVLVLRPTWEVFRELARGAEIMVDGRYALEGECDGCVRLRARRWWDAYLRSWAELGAVFADDGKSRRLAIAAAWSGFARQWGSVGRRFARHYDEFISQWWQIGWAITRDADRWRSFVALWPEIADQEIARARRQIADAASVARHWDLFVTTWNRILRRWMFDHDPKRWQDFINTWRSIGAQFRFNWLTATEPSGRPKMRA